MAYKGRGGGGQTDLGKDCASEDLGMGAGIETQFRRRLGKFPNAEREDCSRGGKEAWHAHG